MNTKNGKEANLRRLKKKAEETLRQPLEAKAELRHFLVLLAITSGLVTVFLTSQRDLSSKKYRVGLVSHENIKADRRIVVEDPEATRQRREQELAKVKQVYIHHVKQLADREEAMRQYFERGRTLCAAEKDLVGPTPEPSSLQEKDPVLALLELPEEVFTSLQRYRFDAELEKEVLRIFREGTTDMTILEREKHISSLENGLVVLNESTGERSTIFDPDRILDFGDKRKLTLRAEEKRLSDLEPVRRDVILTVAGAALLPTLALDTEATEKVRAEVSSRVEPVTVTREKDEIIVRKGDRITPLHGLFLEQLVLSTPRPLIQQMVGLFLFLLLAFFLVFTSSSRFFEQFHPSVKDLAVLCLFLVLSAVLTETYLFITSAISPNLPNVPSYVYEYGVPIVATSMLVRLLMNAETTFVFVLANSILFGVLSDFSLIHASYCLIGSLVATNILQHCTQRISLLRVGFLTGLIGIVFFALVDVLLRRSFVQHDLNEYLNSLVVVLTSGILAAILALAITPVLELFDYVTDIKLLELANSDHPLLSKLALQSPGTHHHSLVVGILAEKAAESIGANPLLAKVASLYHDIGKIAKPRYFIENQGDATNEHDKLTPRMSSLILISHVKDGLELASRYKLPRIIQDIIPQHHGTNLISFFYSKAKDQEDPELDYVDEHDYRYPGPKPQSKEAAIVMMADAIEATARALSEPTPSRLETVVHGTIQKFSADGQFEESDLTFRELHLIAASFTKTLSTAIHHHRIEYPGAKVPRGTAATGRRQQPGKDREQNGKRTIA